MILTVTHADEIVILTDIPSVGTGTILAIHSTVPPLGPAPGPVSKELLLTGEIERHEYGHVSGDRADPVPPEGGDVKCLPSGHVARHTACAHYQRERVCFSLVVFGPPHLGARAVCKLVGGAAGVQEGGEVHTGHARRPAAAGGERVEGGRLARREQDDALHPDHLRNEAMAQVEVQWCHIPARSNPHLDQARLEVLVEPRTSPLVRNGWTSRPVHQGR
mmetsp:Transcript_32885/g.71724  ORF Transcript_32885/g.71724 Transcript_32885/m.71724 type:complete len:219 (+) Transcript_32885:243-899(+)